MEKEVKATMITCDGCNRTLFDDSNNSLFTDGDEALDTCAIEGWWCDGFGHHYCKKCSKKIDTENLPD